MVGLKGSKGVLRKFARVIGPKVSCSTGTVGLVMVSKARPQYQGLRSSRGTEHSNLLNLSETNDLDEKGHIRLKTFIDGSITQGKQNVRQITQGR